MERHNKPNNNFNSSLAKKQGSIDIELIKQN